MSLGIIDDSSFIARELQDFDPYHDRFNGETSRLMNTTGDNVGVSDDTHRDEKEVYSRVWLINTSSSVCRHIVLCTNCLAIRLLGLHRTASSSDLDICFATELFFSIYISRLRIRGNL